jgi:hypothetical protein
MNQLETDLLQSIREIATEKSDYVYSEGYGQCYYHKGPNEGCTGCIVGRAMQKIGWDWRKSKEYMSYAVGGCVNGYDGFSVHRYDFVRDLHDQKLYVGQNFSDKVIKIVVKVQKLQDNGSPWGELLELLPE